MLLEVQNTDLYRVANHKRSAEQTLKITDVKNFQTWDDVIFSSSNVDKFVVVTQVVALRNVVKRFNTENLIQNFVSYFY